MNFLKEWIVRYIIKVEFYCLRIIFKAKEYIRRAKAWRNKYFGADKLGRPSSYLMSLLVVKAYI